MSSDDLDMYISICWLDRFISIVATLNTSDNCALIKVITKLCRRKYCCDKLEFQCFLFNILNFKQNGLEIIVFVKWQDLFWLSPSLSLIGQLLN